jgi:hypothetical protein
MSTRAVLRLAALFDIALGAAVAVLGPRFEPTLGEPVVGGLSAAGLVGLVVALGGVAVFLVSFRLPR